MNVLMINGSPHAKGCTFTALSEVAGELNKSGITTEILQVGHLDIHGCIACGKCYEAGKCVFDDIVNEAARKFNDCDGLVIGSPVHYAAPTGAVSAFLDRFFYSSSGADKTMKVGAAVVSARRGGCTAAFDRLNKYFTISNMPVASSQYWNMVHGHTPEQVRQDLEGMQIMRTLGRNMVFLMKSIALGKEKFGLPEAEQKIFTNFIR